MKTGVRQTNESLSYPNIYYRTFFVAKKKYPQTLKSLGVRVKLKYAKTTIHTLRLYNVRKRLLTSSSIKCGISHS